MFFEIYEDEEAYKAHGASEHFAKYGFGQAIARRCSSGSGTWSSPGRSST